MASVVSDVVGASARAMLEALIAGTTDGAVLADLAQGRMRKKLPELERALLGHFGPHQQFVVTQQLAHIDSLEATIERVSTEIAERLRPDASGTPAIADDSRSGPPHGRNHRRGSGD